MRRRTVPILLSAAALLTVGEMMSWHLHARQQLAFELPAMVRHTFIEAKRRMRPYSTWPRDVNLVLAKGTDPSLASHLARFQHALRPARVRVQAEGEAVQRRILSHGRCKECVVVHYRELVSNPLYARVQIAFSGGDHASAYEETWVNVLGQWVHVRTQLSWMT